MHTPDRWIVITLGAPGYPEVDKVLASWYGGYLYGDSWQLNSGIERVEEKKDHFLFHGVSGSVYKCYKERHGISGIMQEILSRIREEALLGINKYGG